MLREFKSKPNGVQIAYIRSKLSVQAANSGFQQETMEGGNKDGGYDFTIEAFCCEQEVKERNFLIARTIKWWNSLNSEIVGAPPLRFSRKVYTTSV